MNGSWDSGAEYKVNVWPRELYEAQKRARETGVDSLCEASVERSALPGSR